MRLWGFVSLLDVVIPAHEKDFGVLRYAVRSVLRHVDSVGRVIVVAARPFEFPSDRVVWVAEPTRPGFPSLVDVRERLGGEASSAFARAGWLYQQLLKLGAGDYLDGLSSPYLVVDADVVFLRPVSFALPAGRRFVYSFAYEYHEPYRVAYERLFGQAPGTGQSLTAHHMLYDNGLLAEMRAEIEHRQSRPWHEAYVDAADPREASAISEMDIYGWWTLERYPGLAERRQLAWRDVRVIPHVLGRAVYAADFDFVAAHLWHRENRPLRFAGMLRRTLREARASLRPERRDT